jgi:hypothetical protein
MKSIAFRTPLWDGNYSLQPNNYNNVPKSMLDNTDDVFQVFPQLQR